MLKLVMIEMSVGTKALIRFLVWNRLIGNRKSIDILYKYFVMDMSPSQIADELNITTGVVRGKVSKAKQYGLNNKTISYIIKTIYGDLMNIKPIIERNGIRGYRCTICRKEIYGGITDTIAMLRHIEYSHRDVMDGYINMFVVKVIEGLKRKA